MDDSFAQDEDDTITLPTQHHASNNNSNNNNNNNPLLNFTSDQTSLSSSSGVSPLEQEVLDEYGRLLENMQKLSSTLSNLSTGPITLEIADNLRLLERKVTSVYTLMKASVYSIVLQQGQVDEEEQDGGGGQGDETFGGGGGGMR